MKKFIALGLFAALAALFSAGCSHLDVATPAMADRVLTGVVTARVPQDLPADAELIVRVVDLSKGEANAEVLGEQTLKNPGNMPVAFRIEYRAEDSQLLRSIDVEARISVGRRLVFMTKSRHPVTLGNVNDPHTVEVEPVAGH